MVCFCLRYKILEIILYLIIGVCPATVAFMMVCKFKPISSCKSVHRAICKTVLKLILKVAVELQNYFSLDFFFNCFLSERTFRNIWAVSGRNVFHYRCCLLQEWWRHSLCSCHLAPLCPGWHNVPFLCHQFILTRPRGWWNHDDKISKVFTGYFTMFIHVGHQGVQSVIFSLIYVILVIFPS